MDLKITDQTVRHFIKYFKPKNLLNGKTWNDKTNIVLIAAWKAVVNAKYNNQMNCAESRISRIITYALIVFSYALIVFFKVLSHLMRAEIAWNISKRGLEIFHEIFVKYVWNISTCISNYDDCTGLSEITIHTERRFGTAHWVAWSTSPWRHCQASTGHRQRPPFVVVMGVNLGVKVWASGANPPKVDDISSFHPILIRH